MKLRFFLPLLLIASCSSHEDIQDSAPLGTLYNGGVKAYKDGSYKAAIKYFSAVERQYPYSNWATKAQIMTAYCQYLTHSYDESAENFKLFMQLHPYHPQAPYALYMIGLCSFEQLSIIERDQSSAHDALKAFNELITRFPDTPYAQSANKKINILLNHLAGKRVSIGRYNQGQGNFAAAINRFKEVESDYAQTDFLPEAYFRLAESYVALNQPIEARQYIDKLNRFAPQSKWVKYAAALKLD